VYSADVFCGVLGFCFGFYVYVVFWIMRVYSSVVCLVARLFKKIALCFGGTGWKNLCFCFGLLVGSLGCWSGFVAFIWL
jgi:hypothetical protein